MQNDEQKQFAIDVETRAITAVGMQCLDNAELVAEFNRLTGCKLLHSAKRTPLEIAIDTACAYSGERDEDWQKWAEFVMDMVWLRLPEETRRYLCTLAIGDKLMAEIVETPTP